MLPPQACILLRDGDQFESNPETLLPWQRLMREVRVILVDTFGAHLYRIGLLQYIAPPKLTTNPALTSQCIEYDTKQIKRDSIIRIAGYSMKQKQPTNTHNSNGLKDPILTPELIVTSFEIDWKLAKFANARTCSDVCTAVFATSEKCLCVRHDSINGRDIVYVVRNMDSFGSRTSNRYFNTIKSVIDFRRFNIFDHEISANPLKPVFYPLGLESISSLYDSWTGSYEHILLNDKNMPQTNDPMVNLKLSLLPYQTAQHQIEVELTAHTLEEKQNRKISCVVNETSHSCMLSVYSEFDHHISIENLGPHSENLTLELTTGESTAIPAESHLLFNAHQHQKVHESNVLSVVFFIAAAFLTVLTLLTVYFHKKYPEKKSKSALKFELFRSVFPDRSVDICVESPSTDIHNSYAQI